MRVVHVGTGLTGTFGLKAILDDPALELVGWGVSTPAKLGIDAGTFLGRDPVGVVATCGMQALIDLRPDVVMYAASAARREADAVADMAGFLRAGIDVVTFVLESMSFPPAGPVEIRESLTGACREGGSTFYASGSEPGFFSIPLPAVLLSALGRIDRYRERQFALDMVGVYPVEAALRGAMGFGAPSGTMPPRIAGDIVQRWWGPNIHAVAALLGASVTRLELAWETADTAVDLDTVVGRFAAGTVAAYRWELTGIVGGAPAIGVEYVAKLVPEVPVPAHWPVLGPGRVDGAIVYDIEGEPSLRAEVSVGQIAGVSGSLAMTALHCVNAIPHVATAAPGIVTALDLPYYTPRIPAFARR